MKIVSEEENIESKVLITQFNEIERESVEFKSASLSSFFVDFIKYSLLRSRQLALFSWAGFISFSSIFTNIKAWSIQRMYWGRSSLYRSAFHVIIFSITLSSLVIGISSRINFLGANSNVGGLVLASGIVGNSDTLYQAGTAETIAAVNPFAKNWPEYSHTVKSGETLDTIAETYGVSMATIKWANNLSSNTLRIDQVLTIPGLDGVLYEVKKGDTVESIVNSKIIKNANSFDIIELNSLQAPSYTLTEGEFIFIPNAIIIPPPTTRVIASNSSGTYLKLEDPGIVVPEGTFINPLNFCGGYSISRGVLPWHTGVDMAKNGGCWINAVAAGTIQIAGWGSYGQGFYVQIDHGNGFISYYYHGNGEFAVTKGQSVNAGQRILYMGCTGNCTGTHLHFEMRYNGAVVNPANYMSL